MRSITNVLNEQWNYMCARPVNRLELGILEHDVPTEDAPVLLRDGVRYRVIILGYDMEKLKNEYRLD